MERDKLTSFGGRRRRRAAPSWPSATRPLRGRLLLGRSNRTSRGMSRRFWGFWVVRGIWAWELYLQAAARVIVRGSFPSPLVSIPNPANATLLEQCGGNHTSCRVVFALGGGGQTVAALGLPKAHTGCDRWVFFWSSSNSTTVCERTQWRAFAF